MSRDNAGIAAAIARIEKEVAAGAADQITLTGVRATGHHGVFDHEKRDGQDFVVDVTVHTDLSRASDTDNLDHTVHYGELAEKVAAVVGGEPVDLIETLAERIAQVVLEDERIPLVTVTVHKPHAPIPLTFSDVSVTVHRGRIGGPR